MTKQTVSVLLDPEDLEEINDRVREGRFSSRSHAIRSGVKEILARLAEEDRKLGKT